MFPHSIMLNLHRVMIINHNSFEGNENLKVDAWVDLG